MKGILAVSREPLVSMDFRDNPYSSTIDAEYTNFYGDLVKVVTWYDNRVGLQRASPTWPSTSRNRGL